MSPLYAQACLAGSVFFWGGGFFHPSGLFIYILYFIFF